MNKALPWALGGALLVNGTVAQPTLPQHQLPTFTLMRFDEDYNYLAEDSLRSDTYKRLKYIPLTATSYLSLGGEARTERVRFWNEDWGEGNEGEVELKVQGPAEQDTALQIACLFEYTEGNIFTSPPALPKESNGMVHLDQALKGLITDIRKSGRFKGHRLETLLLTPPAGTIPAKQLLLIGLGDRTKFTPELMKDVVTVGFREATRLGVERFSHASDLKDAGVDSPTAEVAKQIIEGFSDAYQTNCICSGKTSVRPRPILFVE